MSIVMPGTRSTEYRMPLDKVDISIIVELIAQSTVADSHVRL